MHLHARTGVRGAGDQVVGGVDAGDRDGLQQQLLGEDTVGHSHEHPRQELNVLDVYGYEPVGILHRDGAFGPELATLGVVHVERHQHARCERARVDVAQELELLEAGEDLGRSALRFRSIAV